MYKDVDENGMEVIYHKTIDITLKNITKEEYDKTLKIYKKIEADGFNKSEPLYVTMDGWILDGKRRYNAACIFNSKNKHSTIKDLPVVFIKLETEEELKMYEKHLQNSFIISNAELFLSFSVMNDYKKLTITKANPAEAFTDSKLADFYKISKRQISKLRFIYNYATIDEKEKISKGIYSINIAEKIIRRKLNSKEANNESLEFKYKNPATNRDIDYLYLGIKFTLFMTDMGMSPSDVLTYFEDNLERVSCPSKEDLVQYEDFIEKIKIEDSDTEF